MAIRQVPPGIKDTNLAGFLRELRAAIGGVSDQVTKLAQARSESGGGGGTNPGGPGPGGTDPGPEPPVNPPTQPTVVLTISPTKPLSEESFTLTATVTGNNPTGRVFFRRDGDSMTLDPYALPSSGVVTHTDQLAKGTYTFVAEYSGDPRNLSATSNSITVEIGSVWDGPPSSVTSLSAEGGVGFITVSWVMPYIGDLDVVEVWASETNDLATAAKVGESGGSLFVYVPDPAKLSWYFWVRVRDSEGLFSDFYPNTAVDGVVVGVHGVAFSLEDEIANSPAWDVLSGQYDDEFSYLQAQINTLAAIQEYDNAATYPADTLVSYNGMLYKAKQETTGNLPTNTTYWDLIGQYQSVGEVAAATALIVDDLKAQYFVKTDVRGLVSGFALYNDGNISDFFVRADRFAVGSPSSSTGTCSISQYTNKLDCVSHGGTWTYAEPPASNIPFIVYTTPQTISAPDGSGKTLTVQPGVYMKSANIQKAFIGDAEIYGHLKSYSWPTTNGVPDAAPGSFPFNGWILDKSNEAPTLKIYGGGFGLWDQNGTPIITAGKIAFSQFRRLVLSGSAEAFVVGQAPSNTVSPSSITLYAYAQNLAGTISLTATSGYSGTFTPVTVGDSATTSFTIAPANFTATVATFTASMTVSGVTYDDTITIAKVQEGSSALVMVMSNESDTVPTLADGSITGTVTLSTNVKVLRGSKNVLYGTGAEASPAWSTAVVMDPVGASYSWTASTGTLSIPMTSASAERVTATITATRGTESVSKVMTVTKQKQGIQGDTGGNGSNGLRGSRQFNLSGYTSWTNAAASAANTLITATNAATTGGYLVLSDTVALTDATTDIVRFYNGGTATSSSGWSPVNVKIDGNLLVVGTVAADALKAGTIQGGTFLLGNSANDTNTVLQTVGFTSGGAKGFRIDGNGNAEFNYVKVRGDILLGGGNLIQNSEGLHGFDGTYVGSTVAVTSSIEANVPYGGQCFKIVENAANTGGHIFLDFMLITASGIANIPCKPNTTYEFSAYTGVSGGTLTVYAYQFLGTSASPTQVSTTGDNVNSASAGGSVLTNFKQVVVRFTTASTATRLLIRLFKSGGAAGSFMRVTKAMLAEVPTGQVSPIPWSPGGVSLLDTLALRTGAISGYAPQNNRGSSLPITGGSTPVRVSNIFNYSFTKPSGRSVVLVITCGVEVALVTTGVYANVNATRYELYRNRLGASLDSRFFSGSITISLDSNGSSIPMYLEATITSGNSGSFWDAYMDVMEVAR